MHNLGEELPGDAREHLIEAGNDCTVHQVKNTMCVGSGLDAGMLSKTKHHLEPAAQQKCRFFPFPPLYCFRLPQKTVVVSAELSTTPLTLSR